VAYTKEQLIKQDKLKKIFSAQKYSKIEGYMQVVGSEIK